MDQRPTSASPRNTSAFEVWLLRFGTAGALLAMLSRGRRPWMLPMALILLILGVIMVGLQSVQYVAPFIYMVF